jgi:2,3-diketo-5-methylthio-1-phosphopentane phosphatase
MNTERETSSLENILVIWDYDWSLINENSDYYIPYKFAPLGSPQNLQFLKEREEYYAQGKSFPEFQNDIIWKYVFNKINKEEFIKMSITIPVFNENIHIVKQCYKYSPNITQIMISNANDQLIYPVLKYYQCDHIFHQHVMYTNPGWFDEKTGKLCTKPYFTKENPHCCLTCSDSPNMCKGKILDQHCHTQQYKEGKFHKKIYIGDGFGDYCAITRLSNNDYAFVRKNFPLHEHINKNENKLECKVCLWENGKELLELFSKVVSFVQF